MFERLSALCACLVVVSACTEEASSALGQRGEGEACKQIADCAAGLLCTSEKCVPIDDGTPDGPRAGDPCTSNAQCGMGLFCGRQNLCTENEPKPAGAGCGFLEECAAPLICGGDGTCRTDDGSVGTADLGEACVNFDDCQRPYICGLTGQCVKLPSVSAPDCSANDSEGGAFRVYYEVPPNDVSGNTDFYRLPFPNDIRFRDGKISLAGHPSPGEVLGINLTQLYFDAVEEDADGFGVNQPVFFRFTDPIDLATVCAGAGAVMNGDELCPMGGAESIYIVDITPSSPTYDQKVPVEVDYDVRGGQFICGNWVGVAPRAGNPLREGTTYAAIVTKDILSVTGVAAIQDQDFAALLGATAPASPPEMVHAHAAMAPLRTWITARSIDSTDIAAAAVFTTGTPSRIGAKLEQATAAATLGDFTGAVRCNTGVTSPCDDGLSGDAHERGCFAESADFYEIHATYQAPVYQAGTRPYRTAAEGGAFVLDANGVPQQQGTETMCVSIAIPRGAAPGGGWPVALYGHGTGGSFRSHINDGTAQRLTALGFAVVGFDNVMHGRRQGLPAAQWEDPGKLFFNAQNPRASRDNILQGAADLFFLTRMVRSRSVAISAPPVNGVAFDATKVVYHGHSQGTVIAPAYLANEAELDGAVLTGAGAELALSILNKQEPASISQGMGALLGDLSISRVNPIMGLVVLQFGAADALPYARQFVHEPPAGRSPLRYLHIYGVGDHFAPDVTQEALIRAAGVPIVGTVVVPLTDVSGVASPASNNVDGVTAGALQYAPDGAYDGHFVVFQLDAAADARDHFLQRAANGTAEIRR